MTDKPARTRNTKSDLSVGAAFDKLMARRSSSEERRYAHDAEWLAAEKQWEAALVARVPVDQMPRLDAMLKAMPFAQAMADAVVHGDDSTAQPAAVTTIVEGGEMPAGARPYPESRAAIGKGR